MRALEHPYKDNHVCKNITNRKLYINSSDNTCIKISQSVNGIAGQHSIPYFTKCCTYFLKISGHGRLMANRD